MNAFYLSDIYIYPIKSLGGMRLQESLIEEKGLQYDRRWMLIDEDGVFITQRKHFDLALLQVDIADAQIIVSHKNDPSISIRFGMDECRSTPISVKIWDDQAHGQEVNSAVSKWFSDFMKMPVRLVKMPVEEKRLVDQRYAANHETVSFADGYPCLLIGQSALDALNEKLDTPVKMDRFRPNFVFTGGEPHVEDGFDQFSIGDISFQAIKPCARCVLITINQQDGLKSPEPLKTLAGYRHMGNKILFGQNLIHQGDGKICVGDEIKVSTWK